MAFWKRELHELGQLIPCLVVLLVVVLFSWQYVYSRWNGCLSNPKPKIESLLYKDILKTCVWTSMLLQFSFGVLILVSFMFDLARPSSPDFRNPFFQLSLLLDLSPNSSLEVHVLPVMPLLGRNGSPYVPLSPWISWESKVHCSWSPAAAAGQWDIEFSA